MRDIRVLKLTSIPSQLIFVHPHPSYYHHFRLPHLDLPSTTPSWLAMSPSPPLRDVGSNSNPSTHSEMPTPLLPPSPFQRDMGGSISLDEGSGEGETWGETQEWEARLVRSKHEPQWKLWFIFSHPSLNPLLMTFKHTQLLPPAPTLPWWPFYGLTTTARTTTVRGIQQWQGRFNDGDGFDDS